MARIEYRSEAPTVEGFIHRVAVDFISNHYRYYVTGYVRGGKDPQEIDRKIISHYNIAIDKWECYRRKKASLANVQYVRHERTFLIVATDPWGGHEFFEREREIRDAHEVPIRHGGYEISYRGRRVWVRIDREHYKRLWAYFTEIAMKRRAKELAEELYSLPYEPYRPVRYQLFRLLDEVNVPEEQGQAPAARPGDGDPGEAAGGRTATQGTAAPPRLDGDEDRVRRGKRKGQAGSTAEDGHEDGVDDALDA